MCRDQFAGAGKPALHLLDVLFGAAGEAEGASGPGPTWSERRAARERFAREIVRDLWGEGPVEAGGGDAGPAVAIPAAVRRRLDEAFVLETDVAAAVASAEAGGPRFSARSGGGLYRLRPSRVRHALGRVRARSGRPGGPRRLQPPHGGRRRRRRGDGVRRAAGRR